jgi:hypothetical protein
MTRIHRVTGWLAVLLAAAAVGCAETSHDSRKAEERIRALELRVDALERSAAPPTPAPPQPGAQLHEQERRELGGLPGAIPSSGKAVTAGTPLRVGMMLQVEWGGEWWAARIIGIQRDGQVKIHYLGWESEWDEVVPRSRLQLDPEAWVKARAAIVPPSETPRGE